MGGFSTRFGSPSLPVVTLDPNSNAYPAGHHYGDGAGLSHVEPNLIAENILYGIDIFGITGLATIWSHTILPTALQIPSPTLAPVDTVVAGGTPVSDTETLNTPAPSITQSSEITDPLPVDGFVSHVQVPLADTDETAAANSITGQTISQISASEDDVIGFTGNYGNVYGNAVLGKSGGQARNNGLVFRNINIPSGATITSAFLTFKAIWTRGGQTPSVIIKGEDSATPSAYGATEDPTTRTYIATTKVWNLTPDNWNTGSTYNSEDISNIITSLISTYGAYVNGVIALGVFDNGSSNDNFQGVADYDDLPASAAILTINWTIGTGNMDLLPSSLSGTGDGCYFGLDTPFDWLTVIVSTAGTGTYAISWKYWNGTSFVALPTFSNTMNSFKTSGGVQAMFNRPVDWAATELAGITAYWIKAEVDSGSMTIQPKGQQAYIGQY